METLCITKLLLQLFIAVTPSRQGFYWPLILYRVPGFRSGVLLSDWHRSELWGNQPRSERLPSSDAGQGTVHWWQGKHQGLRFFVKATKPNKTQWNPTTLLEGSLLSMTDCYPTMFQTESYSLSDSPIFIKIKKVHTTNLGTEAQLTNSCY